MIQALEHSSTDQGVSQCLVTVVGDLVNDTAKWAYHYSINQTL